VRYELGSVWALLTAMLLSVTNALPQGRLRRAMATWVTIVIILIIIVAGVAIIVTLVILPGAPSTTTIYP
jgi:predicted PurR-regulated permease PerM